MKTIQKVVELLGAALLIALALPKAIGLTALMYLESIPFAQFGDGPPTDLKALHEATEKAFKAMGEEIKKAQDAAMKALEEVRTEGTLHAKTNEKLTEFNTSAIKLGDTLKELQTRTTEVEQKLAHRPSDDGRNQSKSIGQIVAESEEFKAVAANPKSRNMAAVTVGSFHKANIVNVNPASSVQPLVAGDRLAGIISPGLRRMTVRDLLPQTNTSSNLIEYAKELLFTNAAAPQGATTSPDEATEGELKAESSLTFEFATTPVVTIAHFIPASRQILSDAPMLQGYIDGRLRYGLMMEEEDELLNGNGLQGTLQGLVGYAAAFTGGATNQTALDTLLKAQLQVSLSEYTISGYVLHPTDWTNILLLKDTTGRYLFSDPHGTNTPRVWGVDVVPTQAMTAGTFLAGAFALAAEIFDREDATVRVAEQHSDFFVRNLCAILAEERLALAVYRASALVTGNVSYAG